MGKCVLRSGAGVEAAAAAVAAAVRAAESRLAARAAANASERSSACSRRTVQPLAEIVKQMLNSGKYVLAPTLLMTAGGQMRRDAAESYFKVILGEPASVEQVRHMLFLPEWGNRSQSTPTVHRARYYEAHQIPFTTGFPFGHGLSYTSFSYARLRVDEATRTVAFDLTNAGGVAGAEVPQLYITFPDAAGEPPLNLKGFRKVTLDPSETVTVTFSLSGLDLSVWDATTHKWSEIKGTFKVAVGASSRDLKLKGTMDNL